MIDNVALVGFASGVAANNSDCALGPWYLYYHPELFQALPFATYWAAMVQSTALGHGREVLPEVEKNLQQLADAVLPLAQAQKPLCVLGGDHSSGIGTWSAVAHANRSKGDIGLIWIDAHMDSHTPETSETQNIHGMPVAHLLGKGVPSLCQLMDAQVKVKPENICLIGIRSYESGEAELLKTLGIKVYFAEEVLQRGIDVVFEEAIQHVKRQTNGFGVSIDMDAIDPEDAPGVGCREPGGINGQQLVQSLNGLAQREPLLAIELTEYNPLHDIEAKTAKLMVELLGAIYC
jgi:arginase